MMGGRVRQRKENMETFVCRKCKSECEIIFDDPDHPFFPTIWCDECNDMAEGFDDVVNDISASAMGDAIDDAHERHKDEQLRSK